MKLIHGDRAAQLVSERVGAPVASLTVLKQTPADRRVDGQIFHVMDADTWWFWNDEASATGDDILAVNPNDAPSTGRFMRMPGAALLAIPFFATTPTGTNVLTVPSNTIIALDPLPYGRAVRVSRIFTGTADYGIAFSSSNHRDYTGIANFAGSMVQTQLNEMFSATAAGTGISFQMCPVPSGTNTNASGMYDVNSVKRRWMKGGDTIRIDVLTGGFGTGIGDLLVACNILQNPGV